MKLWEFYYALNFFAPNFKVGLKFGGHIACPSASHTFEIYHVFVSMNATVLKLHMCITNEKLADQYLFSFLSDTSVQSYASFWTWLF